MTESSNDSSNQHSESSSGSSHDLTESPATDLPEPGAEPLSTDVDPNLDPNLEANATTLDATLTQKSPATTSTFSIGQFLDRLYGTLFLPDQTFTALAETPAVNQGAMVVALVNSLEALRLGRGAVAIPFAIIGGLIGWAWLGLVLQQLAKVFNVNIPLQKILTLTGFASLPWLFIAPALNLPSPWRFLVALAAMIWFAVWQVRAAAKAIDTTSTKLLLLIPLAVFGGMVALMLIGNLIGVLLSLNFTLELFSLSNK